MCKQIKKMKKRQMEICILSDIHLGTYGCQAKKLLNYLKNIEPEMLILNGDIIDIWNFKKSYFPPAHMEVLRRLFKMVEKGVRVVYVTGNHDETLRKYSDLHLGNFLLTDKYIFKKDGKKYWVFHGDVFDSTTKGYAKLIAKLGGKGYDLLIIMNRLINSTLEFFGRDKMSFSKKVKNGVKQAVSWINNFESTAAELGIEDGYDYVVCGHIHQPVIKTFHNGKGHIQYLNSGDWIENLTSLEYNDGAWNVYQYNENQDSSEIEEGENYEGELADRQVIDINYFKQVVGFFI